jgi:D-threo-aldose 1-dehydrogenase
MRPGDTRPRIGLGCAALGTPPPALGDAHAEAVIGAAIARGVRVFDVSPLYGGGLAEERLGRALSALPRDEYVLCTKTGVTRPYAQLPQGREFDTWDYSARATRRSVETSLARLRTDRLDLVHIHDAENHLDRALDARAELAKLRDEGRVGGIGIGSNLAEPVEHLLSKAPFDAFLLAGCYTLLDRSGRRVIESAHASGIRVIAGGVFNSGILAAWPQASPRYAYAPAPPDVIGRAERIASICAAHDVPLGTAALHFVLANPGIDTVLIGPRSIEELDANLAAIEQRVPDALWSDLLDAGLVD